MWCNSVHGEHSCHLSNCHWLSSANCTSGAMKFSFWWLWSSQQSNSWCSSWHRGLPSTAQCFSKKKVQKQRERKHKKPNQRGRNIVATRWQNSLGVAAVAAAQALSAPAYSRFRYSCFHPEFILANQIFQCATEIRLTNTQSRFLRSLIFKETPAGFSMWGCPKGRLELCL